MKKIEVSQEEYDKFIEDSLMLNALKEAGVDSLEGYQEAIEIYEAWIGE